MCALSCQNQHYHSCEDEQARNKYDKNIWKKINSLVQNELIIRKHIMLMGRISTREGENMDEMDIKMGNIYGCTAIRFL